MDLRLPGIRKHFINEINGNEEKDRRAESLAQVELFNDRIYQYVFEKLREQFSSNTVNEMPIISSVNIARRCIKEEASIYSDEVKREFMDMSDEQVDAFENIYNDMKTDSKLAKSNESYKLQNQNHVMVIPKSGKLIMRVLRNHHVTAIPDPQDPETAIGYIISGFDKQFFIEDMEAHKSATGYKGPSKHTLSSSADNVNQKIADQDDYKSELKRYTVWTKDYENEAGETVPGLNFVMDENGNVTSGEDILSPIPETLPILEVSLEKDFEYWVRQGNSAAEFTKDFNAQLSNVAQVVFMQGYAQSWLKGPPDLIPENLVIGPNHVLRLPTDAATGDSVEFGYSNPGSDIGGAIEFLNVLLSLYLTSRGKDPKTISGKGDARQFNAAFERLLAMIEQFSATKEDFSTYKCLEDEIFGLVKSWHNTLIGTDKLDDKYTSTEVGEDASISVEFSSPELIESQQQKVDTWTKKIEQGFASRLDAVMDINNMTRTQAEEKIKSIDEFEMVEAAPAPMAPVITE